MRKVCTDIAAYLLILLFSYTAFSKILSQDFFVSQLSLYPILSDFPKVAGIAIPAAELLAVSVLIIPNYRTIGIYVSLVLLVIFTAYLFIMITTAPTLPCTCGGVISTMTWRQHIFFNCFFIAVSMTAIIYKRKKRIDVS